MSSENPETTTFAAISTQAIVRNLGVAPSTLDYWISKGLCGPSLVAGRGQRFQRFWSISDVVVVRVIKRLRESGATLQQVRRVQAELEQRWGASLKDSVLVWDGHDMIIVDKRGDVMKLLEQSGQFAIEEALRLVSMPFATWLAETRKWSDVPELDVEELETKRRLRIELLQRRYEATPTARIIQEFRKSAED